MSVSVANVLQGAYARGMEYTHLANNLRWYRKQQGWGVRRLAAESGVSIATISRLESYVISSKTADHLPKLADALGISVEQLLRPRDAWPRSAPMRQLAPVRTDRADGPSTNGEVTAAPAEPARRTMAPETEPGRVSMAFELSREGWRALLERVGASMRGTDSDAILGTVFLCPADWMPGMADGQLGWIVKLADEADNGVHAWVRYQNQTRAGQFFLRDGRRWFGFEDGGEVLADAVRVVAVSRGRWMADD